MYWTIGTIPELDHLAGEQRRQLLKRCVGWRTYAALIARSLLVGLLASVAIFAALSPIVPSTSAAVPFWTVLLVIAIAFYHFLLLRVRSALRLELKQTFRGEVLPMCLKCGYNLESVDGNRCPECGAPIRVPAASTAR